MVTHMDKEQGFIYYGQDILFKYLNKIILQKTKNK